MTFRKILVAYDFSEPADRALALGCQLAQKLGASVDIAHVHPEIYDGRGETDLGVPWPSPGQTERYLRFLDSELARVLQERVPAQAEQIRRHVLRGEPVHRLLDLAKELGVDLVCVGATGKRLLDRLVLGSVSEHLLRASQLPVLVTH
jgi:nucleotide-binding universal stress UspA family protein